MAERTRPYDKVDPERKTAATNDIAPEGMDSESEGDELEASTAGDAGEFDDDDHVEPDGVRETPVKQ